MELHLTSMSLLQSLFWPEEKLSQSFSYFKNSFNDHLFDTTTILWPKVVHIDGVALYVSLQANGVWYVVLC